MIRRLSIACALFAAACGGENANSAPPPPAGGQAETLTSSETPAQRHRHIPKEAFDACTSKASGDACSLSFRSRTINGSCANAPEGAPQQGLVCKPEGDRSAMHQAALAACDGKASGDACTVTHENGTASGSCMAPRHGNAEGKLICAPVRRGGKDGGT
ncbi:MAG TPA: hypothetical protein VIF62_00485 [Labilithrix sp.]|jgi:hypothetical protein